MRNALLTLRCQVAWRTGKEGGKSAIRVRAGEEKEGDDVAQLEREMVLPVCHGEVWVGVMGEGKVVQLGRQARGQGLPPVNFRSRSPPLGLSSEPQPKWETRNDAARRCPVAAERKQHSQEKSDTSAWPA